MMSRLMRLQVERVASSSSVDLVIPAESRVNIKEEDKIERY